MIVLNIIKGVSRLVDSDFSNLQINHHIIFLLKKSYLKTDGIIKNTLYLNALGVMDAY